MTILLRSTGFKLTALLLKFDYLFHLLCDKLHLRAETLKVLIYVLHRSSKRMQRLLLFIVKIGATILKLATEALQTRGFLHGIWISLLYLVSSEHSQVLGDRLI